MSATILIVEDSKSIRLLLCFQLKRAGYTVLEAENGVAALKLALGDPRPELIISDVMMPEMDGLEFCRQVRSRPGLEGVPFIFLTSRQQDRQRSEGIGAGATDYVSKPFDARVLLEKIRGYVSVVPQT